MKVKTSVTLSKELIKAIDRYSKPNGSRSEFIEAAVSNVIKQMIRAQQNAHDVEIINRHAESLNREAEDVLEYQVPL
ncbi:MAG: ribbon-helix-helix domain-containing protein [bacterium]